MSVRGAAVWAMGGQYLSFAIQFVTSVIISRFFLSPREVGLFSIALSAALVASVLQDFGLSRYIAGLPTISETDRQRCSTVALCFSLVVAGLIAAAAVPMARTYGQPDLAPIMLIIAAGYLVLPLAVVPMAMMARTMSFHGHFAVHVSGALGQAVVGLTLSWLGYSSFALAWGTLAWNVVRGLVAQSLRPAPPWPLRFEGIRPIVGTGSRLTTIYAIGAASSRTPDMVVGKLLGLFPVGLFSRATSLSDQFRMLISGAIGSVFYPAFARIRDRGDALGPAYLRVCAGYSAIIWPGMAGLALAATPVVRTLYGPVWQESGSLLTMISLTEILLIALPMVSDLPILLGRIGTMQVLSAIDAMMSISLLAAGCHWGVEGAAASRLVYGVGSLVLYGRFMHGLIRFDAVALAGIYARSAAASLAAIAPLAAVYALWMSPATITLPVLVAAVAAGVACWFATLLLLRHPAVDDMLGLLASLPFARRLPLRRLAAG
ncbi:MAG: oligosaccharide flippase family protein [Sphingomonadales bacterium]|nr:oligosaccharide flippase family protein [Sphingomonadales bacterium]